MTATKKEEILNAKIKSIKISPRGYYAIINAIEYSIVHLGHSWLATKEMSNLQKVWRHMNTAKFKKLHRAYHV